MKLKENISESCLYISDLIVFIATAISIKASQHRTRKLLRTEKNASFRKCETYSPIFFQKTFAIFVNFMRNRERTMRRQRIYDLDALSQKISLRFLKRLNC